MPLIGDSSSEFAAAAAARSAAYQVADTAVPDTSRDDFLHSGMSCCHV